MWSHESHTKISPFAKQRHYLDFSVILRPWVSIGRFIMTSLFTFLLISIQVNPQEIFRRYSKPYIPIRFKNSKSWLIYGFCASFSYLQSITKKMAAIKNCKITGWQIINDINELIHSTCKFWGFSKRISPKLFGYRAQIFRDNWNCYALSIFRVFIY